VFHASKQSLLPILSRIFIDQPEKFELLVEDFLNQVDAWSCCFCCNASEKIATLYKLQDVMICGSCSYNYEERGITFNRGELVAKFGFTKSEADKIKRSIGPSTYGGGIKYGYRFHVVVRAIKSKHDRELRNYVLKKMHPRLADQFRCATNEKKLEVLGTAFSRSEPEELRDLLMKTVKKVQVLRQVDAPLKALQEDYCKVSVVDDTT
jgi:hypothetical protein